MKTTARRPYMKDKITIDNILKLLPEVINSQKAEGADLTIAYLI